MITAACPRCGHAVEVSLARGDAVVCGACRYAGPLPSTARVALEQAHAALAAVREEERQLSRAQRLALGQAQGGVGCLGVLSGVLILTLFVGPALTLLFGLAMWWDDEPALAQVVILAAVPTLALGVLTLVLVRRFRRRARSKVQAACAATAPSTPGEPATCRVCGGPVVPSGTQSVVRCGYCRSDNIVSVEALALPVARRARDLSALAQQVQREARTLGTLPLWEFGGTLAILVAAPVLTVVWVFGYLVVILFVLDGPPSEQELYVKATRQGRTCIGTYRAKDPGVGRFSGVAPGFRFEEPLSGEEARPFTYRALVGQTLEANGVVGVAQRFWADGVGTNSVKLDDKTASVTSTCFALPGSPLGRRPSLSGAGAETSGWWTPEAIAAASTVPSASGTASAPAGGTAPPP